MKTLWKSFEEKRSPHRFIFEVGSLEIDKSEEEQRAAALEKAHQEEKDLIAEVLSSQSPEKKESDSWSKNINELIQNAEDEATDISFYKPDNLEIKLGGAEPIKQPDGSLNVQGTKLLYKRKQMQEYFRNSPQHKDNFAQLESVIGPENLDKGDFNSNDHPELVSYIKGLSRAEKYDLFLPSTGENGERTVCLYGIRCLENLSLPNLCEIIGVEPAGILMGKSLFRLNEEKTKFVNSEDKKLKIGSGTTITLLSKEQLEEKEQGFDHAKEAGKNDFECDGNMCKRSKDFDPQEYLRESDKPKDTPEQRRAIMREGFRAEYPEYWNLLEDQFGDLLDQDFSSKEEARKAGKEALSKLSIRQRIDIFLHDIGNNERKVMLYGVQAFEELTLHDILENSTWMVQARDEKGELVEYPQGNDGTFKDSKGNILGISSGSILKFPPKDFYSQKNTTLVDDLLDKTPGKKMSPKEKIQAILAIENPWEQKLVLKQVINPEDLPTPEINKKLYSWFDADPEGFRKLFMENLGDDNFKLNFPTGILDKTLNPARFIPKNIQFIRQGEVLLTRKIVDGDVRFVGVHDESFIPSFHNGDILQYIENKSSPHLTPQEKILVEAVDILSPEDMEKCMEEAWKKSTTAAGVIAMRGTDFVRSGSQEFYDKATEYVETYRPEAYQRITSRRRHYEEYYAELQNRKTENLRSTAEVTSRNVANDFQVPSENVVSLGDNTFEVTTPGGGVLHVDQNDNEISIPPQGARGKELVVHKTPENIRMSAAFAEMETENPNFLNFQEDVPGVPNIINGEQWFSTMLTDLAGTFGTGSERFDYDGWKNIANAFLWNRETLGSFLTKFKDPANGEPMVTPEGNLIPSRVRNNKQNILTAFKAISLDANKIQDFMNPKYQSATSDRPELEHVS